MGKFVSGFKSILVKLATQRLGSMGHTILMTKLINLKHLLGSCVSPQQKPCVGLLTLCKDVFMEICVKAKLWSYFKLKVLESKAWMKIFLNENINEMFRISTWNSQDKAHFSKCPFQDVRIGCLLESRTEVNSNRKAWVCQGLALASPLCYSFTKGSNIEWFFLQNSEISPKILSKDLLVSLSQPSPSLQLVWPLSTSSPLPFYFCPLLCSSSGPYLCLFPSSFMLWSCLYCSSLSFQALDLHRKAWNVSTNKARKPQSRISCSWTANMLLLLKLQKEL